MNAAVQIVKKANRLDTASLNNRMVNDYWTSVFNAKQEGRLVCWYEGVAINPLMQAADVSWVHGEAWSALLAARNNEVKPQQAAENRGYLKELCSYARTHLGCAVTNLRNPVPPDAPFVSMAEVSFVMAGRWVARDAAIALSCLCSCSLDK